MSVDSSQAVEELPKDFLAHPYEILERLRAAGPAHPVIFPHGAKVWLVTRYDDVRQLLTDPRVSKDGSRANHLFARHAGMITDEDETGGIGVNDELTMHMLNSDPPRHTRLRSLANQGLTPRQMEASRPRLEQVADELLNALDDGRPVVDLLAGFTQPMTITTICEVLGVPAEDKPLFHQWAAELVGAGHDPEVVEAASNSVISYARASIEAKRANPGQDMLSMLVHGRDGGDRLTSDELVSMFFLIIMAGHVTSMHTLTNVIHSLLTHPEELAKLRANLSLLPVAIDELIRYDSGVSVGTFRFTKEAIDLGEVTIPAGEILALSMSSAHRDSTKYPDADRLDVTRCPKNHLGFGHGTHYCIGAPLARIQLEVALTKLLTRFPDLQLAAPPESLEWEHGALMRGLVALPVSLHGTATG
ncbi:cytochrome P450 family protein [Jatrophihabitans sp.]|uniref:cytochrome P450 family protein n=1 Tax=Jatrophihabitans sp. TaxID=1932789 RepID=UPI002B7EEEDB|nr:cytochrome P450 [Jatrophihabitans sp.]